MKYVVKPSSTFRRDLKRIEKRGCHIGLLTEVIEHLQMVRTCLTTPSDIN